MEFTPYEIGLPKYGTFMKSQLFGSKFFMGQLVKQYEEPPLHFLQGKLLIYLCNHNECLFIDNEITNDVKNKTSWVVDC